MKRFVGYLASVLQNAAWMFLLWTIFRVLLTYGIQSHIGEASGPVDERVLRLATDVEIHRLQVKTGYDLFVLPLLGLLSMLTMYRRGWIEACGIAAAATIATTVLALGMAYYPALVLSGRIGSRYQTYIGQSVAFAGCTVIVLAAVYVVLRVIERSRIAS